MGTEEPEVSDLAHYSHQIKALEKKFAALEKKTRILGIVAWVAFIMAFTNGVLLL